MEPSIVDKRSDLLQLLNSKLLECDVRWSTFVAAVQSFRYDSLVRPFPTSFINSSNGEKNFEELKNVIASISNFRQIREKRCENVDGRALLLLSWALEERNYSLKRLKTSTFENLKKLTNQVVPAPTPQHVLEVCYNQNKEAAWKQKVEASGNKVIHAYHGTRLENLYSILNTGLHTHLNKTSVYGKGIYLSEELSVSLTWSPLGRGWRESELGDKLGCVLVCEVVDHEDVKCQVEKRRDPNSRSAGTSNSRAYATDSIGGEVPEKYYVVENNELVRVKYILMYSSGRGMRVREEQVSWWQEHRSFLIIIAYVVLLLALGFANSNKATVLYHRFFSYT